MAIAANMRPQTATPTTVVRSASPTEDSRRDLRIDYLRGVAMLSVVVNHLSAWRGPTYDSLYQHFTNEQIGMVTGAEVFVMLSGVVLGMVHRRRIELTGWRSSAGRLFGRARQLYLLSIMVTLSFYAIDALPSIDARLFSDSLRSDSVHPGVRSVLLLQDGPWEVDVLVLYVVLVALSPFALWLLARGQVVLLLAVSWASYLGIAAFHPHIEFPLADPSFPPLIWQLLFVHGLAVGFHRTAIERWLAGRSGTIVVVTAAAVCLGILVVLRVLPEDTYREAHDRFFERPTLGIGRVIDSVAVVIVGYAVLTRFWSALNTAAGWCFVPIGQASLYVFVVHTYLSLVVENLPHFNQHAVAINTVIYTLALAALTIMVRRRWLFRWVPR